MYFVFNRERLEVLELLAQVDLREQEESLVSMVLLAPPVPLYVYKYVTIHAPSCKND